MGNTKSALDFLNNQDSKSQNPSAMFFLQSGSEQNSQPETMSAITDQPPSRIDQLIKDQEQYETAMSLSAFSGAGQFSPGKFTKPLVEPKRDVDTILGDFEQGINYLRQNELSDIYQQLQSGAFKETHAPMYSRLKETLAPALGEQGQTLLAQGRSIGDRVIQYENLKRDRPDLYNSGFNNQAVIAGLDSAKRALTLGMVDGINSDKIKAGDLDEMARAVIQNQRNAANPIAAFSGEALGAILPFGAGLNVLRNLRTAKGLSAVAPGIKGVAAEGAIVEGSLQLASQPQGSHFMELDDNIRARLVNAGIGATLGGFLDASIAKGGQGILKAADWAKTKYSIATDKLLEKALTKEAQAAGFDNSGEYLDSLAVIEQTPQGEIIRPNHELIDKVFKPQEQKAIVNELPEEPNLTEPGVQQGDLSELLSQSDLPAPDFKLNRIAENEKAPPAISEPQAEVYAPAGTDSTQLQTFGRTVKHFTTGELPTAITQVNSASDVAHLTAPLRKDAQESFVAVVTDESNTVLRVAKIYRGDKAGAEIYPGTVAGVVANTPNAKRAMFVHNHPSGIVEQSDLDRDLTGKLHDLLRGSGIDAQGSVVIGPGGKYSYYLPRDKSGQASPAATMADGQADTFGFQQENIPPGIRNDSVDISERRLVGTPNSENPIVEPEQLTDYFKQNQEMKSGVLLFNHQQEPVGFLPLNADELTRLRKGQDGASKKLLSALDETNVGSFAVKTDNTDFSFNEQVAGNMDGFSRQANLPMMDVINANGKGFRAQADIPQQSTFYSNPFLMAGQNTLKDIAREPVRKAAAAAGGSVYGGVSSENEEFSKDWWLDVAQGAALGVVGAQALRQGKILGKGSIVSNSLNRIGRLIDDTAFIGRGSKELRAVKTKQRLLKQLLDRQTGEVGEHLLKRFTPAERATMSDIIEQRGIIQEYNQVHRQAQALDDYLTDTAAKMKELGMLPDDLEAGGYLHRYYAKHLGLDKPFAKAKMQSLMGGYTIARGTLQPFEKSHLSSSARELLAEHSKLSDKIKALEKKQDRDLFTEDLAVELSELKEAIKAIEKTELKEYSGMQNKKLTSFIFVGDEAPKVSKELGRSDNKRIGDIKNLTELEPNDRTWSIKGENKGQAVLHRDWTKAERQKWGEINDAGYRFVRGQAETSHDLSLAVMFNNVAKNSDWAAKEANQLQLDKEWIKVPDTKVNKDSPLKKYGALSGMYVRPDVWNSLKGYGRAAFAPGKAGQIYRAILNKWKMYKTVYNPVTHFNNTHSNVQMYFMSGNQAQGLGEALNALRKGDKSELYREARDQGLFGRDWASTLTSDGNDLALDKIADALRTQPNIPDATEVIDQVMGLKHWWIESKNSVSQADTKLKTGAAVVKAFAGPVFNGIKKPVVAAAQGAQRLYQLEDEFFKLAVFHSARKKGMSPAEAAQEANNSFFDYSDVPQALKLVRDFPIGSPFIFYSYFALPAIARNLAERPELAFALAAGYEAINYAALRENGEILPGEYWEHREAEDELQPIWNKGRSLFGATNTLAIPGLEGYRLALGNAHAMGNPFMAEAGNRKFAAPGVVQSFWGSDIFGSNPLRVFLDLIGNEDWKGKEIYSPGAPTDEKTSAMLSYLYQAWAPSHLLQPGSYHQQKVIDGMANQENAVSESVVELANKTADALGMQQFTGVNRMGKEANFRDALAGSVGIKMRPNNLQDSLTFRLREIDQEQAELAKWFKKKARLSAEGRVSEGQQQGNQQDLQKRLDNLQAERTRVLEAYEVLSK
jgi:DNA repair proteins